METEIDNLKRLFKEAYDHLEYCNWGDLWERESSEELRKELNEYFEKEKAKLNTDRG